MNPLSEFSRNFPSEVGESFARRCGGIKYVIGHMTDIAAPGADYNLDNALKGLAGTYRSLLPLFRCPNSQLLPFVPPPCSWTRLAGDGTAKALSSH